MVQKGYHIKIDIMKYHSLKTAIHQNWLRRIETEQITSYWPNFNIILKIDSKSITFDTSRCKDIQSLFISKKMAKPTSVTKWENFFC